MKKGGRASPILGPAAAALLCCVFGIVKNVSFKARPAGINASNAPLTASFS